MRQWRFFFGGLLFVVALMGSACHRETKLNQEKKVHLSFDDGAELQVTMVLLETLARHHIPASFFEVGNRLASLPDHGHHQLLAKYKAGHVLGNHSFSHPQFTQLSQEAIAHELQQTAALLADFAPMKLVRPPFGADDDRVRKILRDLGYVVIKWDVQASEYGGWEERYRNHEQGIEERFIDHIVQKVKQKNGGILLLHDESALTIATLEKLIVALQQQGFVFVPLEYFLDVRS